MAHLSDPHDPPALDRFLDGQRPALDAALDELRCGRKRSHWMWFIFPQLRGLGQSPTAHLYGITDLDEAARYLAHPVLGPRLRLCAEAVMTHPDRTAEEMLGPVDAAKLRSCATLFALAAPAEGVFTDLLDLFFAGRPCLRTLHLLGAGWPPDRASP